MNKEQKSTDKRIRMLCFMDSPRVSTGFGVVANGIFNNLAKTGRYIIDIFGVNDLCFLDPDPVKYPYRILPAMIPGIQGDFYGRVRFINILRGADPHLKPAYDIVFTLNDPFIFEEPTLTPEVGMMDAVKDLQALYRKQLQAEHWFSTVSYWPVDAPIKENWVEHAIGLADYSIAYTEYGKKEIERVNQKLQKPFNLNLDVIYHGTDTVNFHPISEQEKMEFKKSFFKKVKTPIENLYIVGIVARNQVRKDLPRVMRIFKEFQKRRPDSLLYIHARENDVGGSLGEYARNFNLELGKDWIFPGNFNENIGYPIDALNRIYNIMDVQLSATTGEGWGLPISESFMTKTLNIAPNITSIPEIFNTVGNDYDNLEDIEKSEIRGIPIKSGVGLSDWQTIGSTDYERIRPLTNVEDAVKKMIWAYDNQEKTKPIVERAYKWVQQYSWQGIAQKWDELFQKVYNNLEKEREDGKKQSEISSGKADDASEKPSNV